MMKFRENTAINLIVTFIFETCRGDFCISRSPKAQLKFQQVGGCSSCICSPPLLALLLPPDQNPHSLLIHPSTVDYEPQTSYLNSQHQLGGPNCSGPLSAGLHVTHFMQLHFATLRRINKDKSYTRMAEQKIGNNLGFTQKSTTSGSLVQRMTFFFLIAQSWISSPAAKSSLSDTWVLLIWQPYPGNGTYDFYENQVLQAFLDLGK